MPKFVRPTTGQYEEFYEKFKVLRKLSTQEKIDLVSESKKARDLQYAILGFMPKHSPTTEKKMFVKSKGDGFEDIRVYERIFENVPYWKTVKITLMLFTTSLPFKDDVRTEDVTRCIITDSRFKKPVYYTPSILRTENYFIAFGKYTAALINRLDTYPCCENCGTPRPIKLMRMSKNNPIEEKLFAFYLGKCVHCTKTMKDYKGHAIPFYHGMAQEHVDFLSKIYKRYFQQRNRTLEKTGSLPEPRVFIQSERNKKNEGERYERVYNDGPHTD